MTKNWYRIIRLPHIKNQWLGTIWDMYYPQIWSWNISSSLKIHAIERKNLRIFLTLYQKRYIAQ
ncbi:Hypothetical protein I595_522 [Croceitalea dokdonensis DOKDO 023]|uniref:Uncharacterized protein n=1 Tax=Croceitalea dokdonensis DOKDO 023 TaxID=1300341 RepID=A0A0P7AXS3_9FLAO|nr:Hypothetical protein I595_522 [Croceitalea dokdonensis DOKDO 023]